MDGEESGHAREFEFQSAKDENTRKVTSLTLLWEDNPVKQPGEWTDKGIGQNRKIN